MTFIVNNYDHLNDDPDIQESLAKARAWEAAFVSFLKNYTTSSDKPDFMDVAFNSERSIQDEIERTSTGEVRVMGLAYLLMLFYIMFALGKVSSSSSSSDKCCSFNIKRFFVERKFSLSLFGVILVFLSAAASVGLFGFIGVPSTLITFQILPFLVSKEIIYEKYQMALY